MPDQHTSLPASAASDASAIGDSTDFGFTRVLRRDKPALMRGLFGRVASRYDLMNDLMSGGAHRAWKGALVDWLNPRPGWRLVDLAGGTGDVARLALARADRATTASRNAPAQALILDATPAMLTQGRDHGGAIRPRLSASAPPLEPRLTWLAGEAERLPLADASVEAITCAFGLRNMTALDAALAESRRVLRPGGRFLALELSHVVLPLLRPLYDAYSFGVLPRLGGLVAGDAPAYRYLVESIRRFPPQDQLARRMAAAGFARVTWRNLMGGIAALHSGWRL
jgi:demethylmenaquinone methyltransferase/2-methoxy-6-polyprenyl-1,4-benzoquinol methylase